MIKEVKLDLHFLSMAWLTALNLSKDPNTKVGALIVSEDGRQISAGYNGFPAGVEETNEKWQSPTKFEYVIHAELNAIFNCPFDTKNCTVYTTLQPCHRCMGNLVNAKIKKLVFNKYYDKLLNNSEYYKIWMESAKKLNEVIQIDVDLKKFLIEPNIIYKYTNIVKPPRNHFKRK